MKNKSALEKWNDQSRKRCFYRRRTVPTLVSFAVQTETHREQYRFGAKAEHRAKPLNHPSENVMNKIVVTTLAALVLSAPAVSFAQQTDGGVTRAQVRSELIAVEQAGYRPNTDYESYPVQLQAAERKVAMNSSYGSSIAGTSSAGVSPRGAAPVQSTFFGQ